MLAALLVFVGDICMQNGCLIIFYIKTLTALHRCEALTHLEALKNAMSTKLQQELDSSSHSQYFPFFPLFLNDIVGCHLAHGVLWWPQINFSYISTDNFPCDLSFPHEGNIEGQCTEYFIRDWRIKKQWT